MAAGTGGRPREQQKIDLDKILTDTPQKKSLAEEYDWQVLDEEKIDIKQDDTEEDEDMDEVPDEMDDTSETGNDSQSQMFMKGQMYNSPTPSKGANQIKSYTDWKKMPLKRSIVVKGVHASAGNLELNLQEEPMDIRLMTEEEKEDAQWQCNGVEVFEDGCKSGITDFGFHLNIRVWSNDDFDFDFCEMCIRWTLHCEISGTKLNLASDMSQ